MVYDPDNDVERIFNTESSEKKRIGRGIYAMKGKRGYVGKMVTPVDFMTKKEKREYIRGGDIKLSNLYEDINNIPSYEDLLKKAETDKAGAKATFIQIRKLHTNSVLQNKWKCTNHMFYKLAKILEIELQPRPQRSDKKNGIVEAPKVETVVEQRPTQNEILENMMINAIEKYNNAKEQAKIINVEHRENFEINYYKTSVNGDAAIDRITNLITILDPKLNYKVEFKIVELE